MQTLRSQIKYSDLSPRTITQVMLGHLYIVNSVLALHITFLLSLRQKSELVKCHTNEIANTFKQCAHSVLFIVTFLE